MCVNERDKGRDNNGADGHDLSCRHLHLFSLPTNSTVLDIGSGMHGSLGGRRLAETGVDSRGEARAQLHDGYSTHQEGKWDGMSPDVIGRAVRNILE